MSLPDQTPKLPKLPFIIGDVILLAAAWFIANRDPAPLGVHAIAAVTACVVLAAVMGAIPFLTDYARKQDEALDERQRGLEALSRTITTAAEQISIAANGLNELTDLTHKNLKQAEQLPHKLQDKIAEFNAQLNNARENDREELEKEVAELRTSETDRLQAISDKVHKAVGELTRLDAAVQQQLGSRTEQLERAQALFAKTQTDTIEAIRQSHAALSRDLAAAQVRALEEIDRHFSAGGASAARAIEEALNKTLSSGAATEIVTGLAETPEPSVSPSTASPAPDLAPPAKKQRKARREETPASPVYSGSSNAAPSPQVEAPAIPELPPAREAAASAEVSPTPAPFAEPAPVPLEAFVQIEPVAPASAEPFGLTPSGHRPGADAPRDETSPPAVTPAPRTGSVVSEADTSGTRKTGLHQTGALRFDEVDDDASQSDETTASSGETSEGVISSDGATRLIATSYIGIGNRLFIRGDGPGLTWEKGVPLQFISIGKWRWETPDATAPVRFKLYKNDEMECPGLGALVLEPGHQQDVVAKF